MTERWKPETNEMYWFIPKDGEVIPFCWCDDEIDRTCFNFGNCFRTEEEAEAAAEKVKDLLLDLHKNPENLRTSPESLQILRASTIQINEDDSVTPAPPKKNSHATPDHYKLDPEPIAVIKAWGLDFCLGNVLKYVARAGRKAGESRDSDLHKAMNYLRLALEDEK